MSNPMAKAHRQNIQARLKLVDQALRQINMTIERMKGMRELPGGIMGDLETQKEKLVAEKIELTGALDIGDAVNEEPIETAEQEERKRTDASQSRPAFEKPGKKWKDYKYEELFHENIDGDLILTFPDDILKETGWKEGDVLDFEVIHGNLHIRKRVLKT